MDKLAKQMLHEAAKPMIEKMLHPNDKVGISAMELEQLGEIVDIAKDLIEIDYMLIKIDKERQEHYVAPGSMDHSKM